MEKNLSEYKVHNNEHRRRRIAAVTVLIFAVLLTFGSVIRVNAGSGDCGYEVVKLDMRVTVNKDHTYEVEEFISVDISEDLAEIEFDIPSGTYRITDPEQLTAGRHRYTTNYTIHEGHDRDKEKDHFAFYVIDPEWKKPAAYVHALIAFPYGFPLEDIRCTAVINGKPDSEERFDHKPEVSSRSYTVTGRGIPENYSYCIEADLPEGYWTDSHTGLNPVYAALAAGCVICLSGIKVYRRKGNHRHR